MTTKYGTTGGDGVYFTEEPQMLRKTVVVSIVKIVIARKPGS